MESQQGVQGYSRGLVSNCQVCFSICVASLDGRLRLGRFRSPGSDFWHACEHRWLSVECRFLPNSGSCR